MVCQPPWSSRRRNNHCQHELGNRSDSQIKGFNLLSQVALHEYFTDLHIAKGKAAAGSGSSECIGFPLAQRQLPPGLTGASTLTALHSQPAPISGLQNSAGGTAAPAKAR